MFVLTTCSDRIHTKATREIR